MVQFLGGRNIIGVFSSFSFFSCICHECTCMQPYFFLSRFSSLWYTCTDKQDVTPGFLIYIHLSQTSKLRYPVLIILVRISRKKIDAKFFFQPGMISLYWYYYHTHRFFTVVMISRACASMHVHCGNYWQLSECLVIEWYIWIQQGLWCAVKAQRWASEKSSLVRNNDYIESIYTLQLDN